MLEDHSGKTSQGTTNMRINHKRNCLDAMFQSSIKAYCPTAHCTATELFKEKPLANTVQPDRGGEKEKRRNQRERASHRIGFLLGVTVQERFLLGLYLEPAQHPSCRTYGPRLRDHSDADGEGQQDHDKQAAMFKHIHPDL